MPTNFPAALDTTTNLPTTVADATTQATNHPAYHNTEDGALIAIETKIGINASTPTNGQVLTGGVTPGTSSWATPVSGFADPLTTNGDVIARVGGVTTRLAQGGAGTYLGVSGGVLGYTTPPAGGSVAILAAAPTGVAATDSLVFSGATTGQTIQLRTGTYILNPTTLNAASVTFLGTVGTIVQLAGQGGGASTYIFNVTATSITFNGITFDGNKATIASGTNNYWSGLINVAGGADDFGIYSCTVQNTARSGIYAIATSTRINRPTIEACHFTGIGYGGASTGGSAIMFDGGVQQARIIDCRADGQLSSNFLKSKEAELPTAATTYVVAAGTTATSIIATTSPWVASVHKDTAYVRFITGALSTTKEAKQVTGNTTNTLAVTAFSAVPAVGDTFRVYVKNLGGIVADNVLDYRNNTTWDTSLGTLGIELFHGSWDWRCNRNQIYGPDSTPTSGGYFWGISASDCRGTVFGQNVIIGSDANPSATGFGLEVAESPHIDVIQNRIKNCSYGSNFSNNNYSPSHSILIEGNIYESCITCAIYSDSAPSAFKIIGNTFIDCGTRFIWFNNTNVGGGNGTVKDGVILGCTFQLRDQITLDGEGHIFGVYISSVNESDVARVTIGDCHFGPYPLGTGTVALKPIKGNKPLGAKVHHCHFDGLAPTGGAKETLAIEWNSGDLHVDHCSYANFSHATLALAALNATAPQPFSTFEHNLNAGGNAGTVTHGVGCSSVNCPLSVTWWDANGHLRTVEYMANNITVPTATTTGVASGDTSPPAAVITALSGDGAGRVTFGSGTGSPTAGARVRVNFNRAYVNAPWVIITPLNAASGAARDPYISAVTTTDFTIAHNVAPPASQGAATYAYSWMVVAT